MRVCPSPEAQVTRTNQRAPPVRWGKPVSPVCLHVSLLCGRCVPRVDELKASFPEGPHTTVCVLKEGGKPSFRLLLVGEGVREARKPIPQKQT